MAELTKKELLKYPQRPVIFASITKKKTGHQLSNGQRFIPQKLIIDGKELIVDRVTADQIASAVSNLKGTNFKLIDAQGKEVGNGNLYKTEDYKSGKASYNKGDMAEGIFGAAITARFINKDSEVTLRDVEAILSKLTQQGRQTMKFASPNKNPKIKDDVEFVLGLAANNMKALCDRNIRAMRDVVKITEAAVAYANSKTVRQWSSMVYQNNIYNKIQILSDGLSDQTGTKVDVRVLISNHDGQLKPTNINVSLKAGDVKQFGQMGGSTFDTFERLFDELFALNISRLEREFNTHLNKPDVKKAIQSVYKGVAPMIADVLSKDDKKALKHFATAIQHHATRGEKDVTLVQLNRGKAKVYTFENLEKAFAKIGPFTAQVKVGGGGLPQIDLFARGMNEGILRIRVKGGDYRADGSPYFRNVIEKLNGLGDLIAHYAGEDD